MYIVICLYLFGNILQLPYFSVCYRESLLFFFKEASNSLIECALQVSMTEAAAVPPVLPAHLLSLSRLTEDLAGHISNLRCSHDNMTRFCSCDGNKSSLCNFCLVPQEKRELSPPLSLPFFLLSLFPEAGVWIWGEPSLTINLGTKTRIAK